MKDWRRLETQCVDWCEWCGQCVSHVKGERHPLLMSIEGGQPAHASTCPNRVRIADLGVRKHTDHVQKLIPAAAKMRAPVTIRARRK